MVSWLHCHCCTAYCPGLTRSANSFGVGNQKRLVWHWEVSRCLGGGCAERSASFGGLCRVAGRTSRRCCSSVSRSSVPAMMRQANPSATAHVLRNIAYLDSGLVRFCSAYTYVRFFFFKRFCKMCTVCIVCVVSFRRVSIRFRSVVVSFHFGKRFVSFRFSKASRFVSFRSRRFSVRFASLSVRVFRRLGFFRFVPVRLVAFRLSSRVVFRLFSFRFAFCFVSV